MKHFGNQLDELFKKKRIIQKDFAEKMGVTTVTITKWKSKESIDAATLEEISKVLNVPISYWFDLKESASSIVNGDKSAASVYGDAMVSTSNEKDKEIEHLKQLLEEKERTIQILMNK
jgi:transcriptional regulator with XRE-family HTH domain